MAKKTKKIETPIDQRETFVSIQKNFADSDLSVSEKLQTLYALQQADTALEQLGPQSQQPQDLFPFTRGQIPIKDPLDPSPHWDPISFTTGPT